MTRSSPALATVLVCSLTIPLAAQVTPCHDFTPVDTAMAQMVNTLTPGASVSIQRYGEALFERHYGTFAANTVVPIASSSKWLSAGVIMSLVDDGLIDLDTPISTYLPNFTGTKGTMTVRQLFSHTSGMPGDHWVLDANTLTLEQAVNILAFVPLRTTPGTDFFYGGVSMHIAGRIAEVVSGQSWATLFQTRIAGPLQMTSTDYLTTIGSATNPRIAGGARSSLADLSKFTGMLLAGGQHNGNTVLSWPAVLAMTQDQTGGVPVTYAPVRAPGHGYAIGAWIERTNGAGAAVEISSQGAFGCTPWLDFERGVSGVFLVDNFYRLTDPTSDAVRTACYDIVRYRSTACYGGASPTCAGFARAYPASIPRPGDHNFGVFVNDAPATTLGAIVIGLNQAFPPIRVAGVPIHVDLFGPTISSLVFSDVQGTAYHPASLYWAPSGLRLYMQFAFLRDPSCAGPDAFVATSGLAVFVE